MKTDTPRVPKSKLKDYEDIVKRFKAGEFGITTYLVLLTPIIGMEEAFKEIDNAVR
tara:strand:+ start:396 stop:563 length:168 start_codon:yes stop_codon:yes gene_type:complete